MVVVKWRRLRERRAFLLGNQIRTIVLCGAAALLAGAAECAYCQVDSFDLSAHLSPPTQGVISKNQLLIPEKAQKALNRAQQDFMHRNYESTERDVQQALEIYPHCALAFIFQGVLNLQGGNPSEAAQAFQQAIDEDPASGPAYVGLGVIYNSQGRFRDAIALFDRAAPFVPGSWLVNFEAAFAHLGVGEPDAGLKDIARAEKFAGNDQERLAGLAYLRGVAQCQLRDFDGGHKYLQEAVRRDPNGTFAMLARKRLELIAPLERDRH